VDKAHEVARYDQAFEEIWNASLDDVTSAQPVGCHEPEPIHAGGYQSG
jgi:hypothetical protein